MDVRVESPSFRDAVTYQTVEKTRADSTYLRYERPMIRYRNKTLNPRIICILQDTVGQKSQESGRKYWAIRVHPFASPSSWEVGSERLDVSKRPGSVPQSKEKPQYFNINLCLSVNVKHIPCFP